MTEPRRDGRIGRVTGEAAASEANLHHDDCTDDDIDNQGQSIHLIAGAGTSYRPPTCGGLDPLENRRDALATADAHRDECIAL